MEPDLFVSLHKPFPIWERLLETEQKFIGWEKSERYGAS